MKIAMLIPSLAEKGPIIVALNIAKYNFDKNIKFIFISLRYNSEIDKKRFRDLNFEVYELGMSKVPTMKAIYKFGSIVKKISPDIIHVHCFWPTLLSYLFVKRYNVIVTLHNNPFEDYKFEYGAIIGKIMATLSLKIVYSFKKIIAISNYVKNVCKNNEISVVYNSTEDLLTLEEKIYLRNNTLHVISVSVLNKRKNIETALRAIRYIKNKGKKIKYTIIGDGELRQELEKITKELDLVKEVIFLGTVDRKDAMRILDEQDVLLFPSISEGLGLVAIEAMMKKVVVIGSDIPVMNEIIDNFKDGFICKVFDYEDYGKCLLQLYDITLLESMSLEARNKYLNKFKMKYMVEGYNEIYYKCLKLNGENIC
ncbi:glycosyltransferase family 4 protein [Anaerosinus massiliensis]|uniref:glycosyltransferase family 4 protein n=1 Tax=Massilibacillus massiliensis TaxID=1806837 RepID=UPI000DA5F170|nr:glycosyltransferase family 4 protein [Massilibacillus massiliensis]